MNGGVTTKTGLADVMESRRHNRHRSRDTGGVRGKTPRFGRQSGAVRPTVATRMS